MRSIAPYILVELDLLGHRTKRIGDVEIELQKQYREDFNKRYSNCDRGWVVALPNVEEIAGSPMILKEGDYVFFHYHTFQPINEVYINGKSYYKVHYSNVFFKLDGDDIVPLNRFVFTEILTKRSTLSFGSLVLFDAGDEEELLNKSRVAFKPPYVDSVDLREVVYHRENTHYDIELPNGTRYYRIREKDIIGRE